MLTGVAYYPEHVNETIMREDFQTMKEAGLKRIRIAEFAWSTMEPEKGVFNWQWLDRAIEIAAEYEIDVVLCTPTACPPIWLIEEFPETLPVNEEGRRDSFGARQHRCYNATEFLKRTSIIVEEMAKRYGKNPNVAAWQIDNELGAEQKWCFCETCNKGFQDYLSEKYGDIKELNRRYGNVFWSMEYQNFSQINVPLNCPQQVACRPNPALKLDFMRFSSDSVVNFNNMQVDIIKKFSDNQPVNTNMYFFRYGDNVDWVNLVKKLDVAAIDVYTDDLCELAFYMDFMESLKPGNAWYGEFGPNVKNLPEVMDLLAKRNCQ